MLSNKEIGERIRQRRLSLGLTAEDVGDQIKMAKTTVLRYELGQIKRIKLMVIESMADVLKVDPGWLIGTSPTPEIKNRKPDEHEMDLINSYRLAPSNVQQAVELMLEPYSPTKKQEDQVS